MRLSQVYSMLISQMRNNKSHLMATFADNIYAKRARFYFIPLFALALSACAETSRDAEFFTVQNEILIPISGLYLGDNPPKCNDETSTMVQINSDKQLYICTGTEKGWRKVNSQKAFKK